MSWNLNNEKAAKGPKDETTLIYLRSKQTNRKTVCLEAGKEEGKLYKLNLEGWAMARSRKAKRPSFSAQVIHGLVQEADSLTNVYTIARWMLW